jgi:hypothetical protein
MEVQMSKIATDFRALTDVELDGVLGGSAASSLAGAVRAGAGGAGGGSSLGDKIYNGCSLGELILSAACPIRALM